MLLPNIGLVGKARTGKDTAAGILAARYGYTPLAFAGPLRDLLADLNPLVALPGRYRDALTDWGYEKAKDIFPEVRRLLQALGTGAREHLGADVWVDALAAKVAATSGPVAVTDVRFPNEADRLRTLGFTLIRLTRAGAPSAGDHVSETALDGFETDFTYANNETIDDLGAFLAGIVGVPAAPGGGRRG